jgi:predicted nucleic acid-binding protein
MRVFADTSLLCALFHDQENSDAAKALAARQGRAPIFISDAVEFEFRASTQFHAYLHASDKTKGYKDQEASSMLSDFDAALSAAAIVCLPCNWAAVFALATDFARMDARSMGARPMDILHVAAACHLGADCFASFDKTQRQLAQKHNLKLLPDSYP